MSFTANIGIEVQRPLVTAVISGILYSATPTLIELPKLYRLLHGRDTDGEI